MRNHVSPLVAGIKIIFIFGLVILVIIFQTEHDQLQSSFTAKLNTTKRNLLPSEILPFITFGFRNFIADYYWISSVQDLIAWDGKESYFINYFKNISVLDPKFEYPYLFSILTVPQIYRKDTDPVESLNKVAEIADKGIESIPTSWQIPFYLATQYYLFTKQYEPATTYLEMAAKRKGAPDGVYLVYSTFVSKTVRRTKNLMTNPEQKDTATSLVKIIYDNTDSEVTKDLIAKGLQVESIRQMLDKAILAYKTKYKKNPKNAYELINDHLISLPDDFLEDFDVIINSSDGSFKIINRI